MRRSSHQAFHADRLAISLLALSILIFVGYSKSATGQRVVTSVRPETREEKITRATFKVTNRCPQPHRFRIKSDIKDPRFKQQTDAILVRASATEQIEVLFDATGSKTDLKAGVECLDCKKEDGCAQDPYEVPIELASENTSLSSGRSVSTRFSSGLSTQGANDVGIIPENPGGCPGGSAYMQIGMDDEDNNIASSVHNWVGAISRSAIGTTFGFCRVDGNQFHSLPTRDYAVLQLGNCPNGSVSVQRAFDNEHNHNQNWSTGTIAPSSQSGWNTYMYFCLFRAGVTPTMTSFPNLIVAYGVFAAAGGPWLATGYVHTDDEDGTSTPDNTCMMPGCVDHPYLNTFANIIYGTENSTPLKGKNTNLLVAKVTPNSACVPCPYIGSYDTANCWVGQPPAGTSAFIWSTNFYYTPVSGNQCPRQGSSYDGANCFVMAIPPQTHPFIWANMWYVQPACRP